MRWFLTLIAVTAPSSVFSGEHEQAREFTSFLSSVGNSDTILSSSIEYFPISGGMKLLSREEASALLSGCTTSGKLEGDGAMVRVRFECGERSIDNACYSGDLELGLTGEEYVTLSLHEKRDVLRKGCMPFAIPQEKADG